MQHLEIPVACVQTRAHDRDDFDTAWPRIAGLAEDAARAGAALIVLPEGTVPGYVLGNTPVAREQLERAARDVGALARTYRTTIVYGGAKLVNGLAYNAAIAVGPDGNELGFAAKQFLWHFDRRWFAPGTTLDPIDAPFGKLGLLVCADGRIPSIAATLADRGADLLVMPTAWVTSGRNPDDLENAQADLMARVRARENGVPFVAANKTGVECESVAYCGKSSLFSADGDLIARGSETREEIVTGRVVIRDRARVARHTFAGLGLAAPAEPRARARIAFTLVDDDAALARLRALATEADADLLFAPRAAHERAAANAGHAADAHAGNAAHERAAANAGNAADAHAAGARLIRMNRCDATLDAAGITVATLAGPTLRSPRALVDLRLAGIDCFVWFARDDDAAWHVAYARTRAMELRAFVVVFDTANERAFAVDPDGVVVAGTFGAFHMAAFAYDRARSSATAVAPTTDVAAGLRTAEAIRARGAEALHA